MRPRMLSLFTALSLGVFLAACGGGTAPAKPPAAPKPSTSAAPAPKAAPKGSSTTAAAASKPLRHVSFRLPFLIAGYDAPFVLAKAKGWYQQAGLDVTIGQGKGSAVTAETVGNGADTFGFADGATAAQTISKGNPIKMLAGLTQSTPMAFYTHQPLTSVQQLKGQKILTFSGDADLQVLPAVLAKGRLTMQDVHPVFVSVQAIPATFARSPGMMAIGFQISNGLDIVKIDPKAYVTPYSKFGVNPMSQGLIASLNEIKSHPNEVRAFVAASLKGWAYVLASPAHQTEALDDTKQAFPNANLSLLKKSLDISLTMVRTPASQGKPLGWMAKSDWQSTIALLHKYGALPTVKPLSDYYTNQFVPTTAS